MESINIQYQEPNYIIPEGKHGWIPDKNMTCFRQLIDPEPARVHDEFTSNKTSLPLDSEHLYRKSMNTSDIKSAVPYSI